MEANSLKPSWMSKDRWMYDVMKDIQAVKIVKRKRCAQDRDKWKSIVDQAKTRIELQRLV
jgi:hypothetical protein